VVLEPGARGGTTLGERRHTGVTRAGVVPGRPPEVGRRRSAAGRHGHLAGTNSVSSRAGVCNGGRAACARRAGAGAAPGLPNRPGPPRQCAGHSAPFSPGGMRRGSGCRGAPRPSGWGHETSARTASRVPARAASWQRSSPGPSVQVRGCRLARCREPLSPVGLGEVGPQDERIELVGQQAAALTVLFGRPSHSPARQLVRTSVASGPADLVWLSNSPLGQRSRPSLARVHHRPVTAASPSAIEDQLFLPTVTKAGSRTPDAAIVHPDGSPCRRESGLQWYAAGTAVRSMSDSRFRLRHGRRVLVRRLALRVRATGSAFVRWT
jgi:hypothetical protein